ALRLDEARRRRLIECLMLFYTGMGRRADDILREQQSHIEQRRALLRQIKAQAPEVREALDHGPVERLGPILDHGWALKRQMASRISNACIDEIYQTALDAGAAGGKITGAG